MSFNQVWSVCAIAPNEGLTVRRRYEILMAVKTSIPKGAIIDESCFLKSNILLLIAVNV